MTNQGKRELLKAFQPRFLKASKAQKGSILEIDLVAHSSDNDSGSEFIDHHLVSYCREEHITSTCTRPDKKVRPGARGAKELDPRAVDQRLRS